jgi:inosose dehydratase
MSAIKLSYALNSWRPTYDTFVRPEHHTRALKTVSVSGFHSVELSAGAGRWEPMGNREMMEVNHGSVAGFAEFLRASAIDSVSSYFLDPGAFMSVGGVPFAPGNPADTAAIVELTREYLTLLAALGGNRLVVRPAPAFWRTSGLPDPLLKNLAHLWNEVGALAAAHGVQVALHVDCLSAVRTEESIGRLLDATNPQTVGLAIDTAELVLAGLDPLAVYKRFASRVNHVQFKDVVLRDDLGEATQKNAEHHFLSGGGSRAVARWFWEMGTPGGLVDFPELLAAMQVAGYQGWIVAESDQSPYPATSAMLNGWYFKHKLAALAR